MGIGDCRVRNYLLPKGTAVPLRVTLGVIKAEMEAWRGDLSHAWAPRSHTDAAKLWAALLLTWNNVLVGGGRRDRSEPRQEPRCLPGGSEFCQGNVWGLQNKLKIPPVC